MNEKITIEEWLTIVSNLAERFLDAMDNDGKISVREGITIAIATIGDIIKALKSN